MLIWFLPVVVAGAGLWLWGRFFLPRRRQCSRDILIEAPVERVWGAMTDFLRQVEWRSDLRSVEMGSDPPGEERWCEQPRRGPANHFRVARVRRARMLEVERLPNGLCAGGWTATLERAAQSTHVTFTETILIERPMARVLARVWLHGGAALRRYPLDLKSHLEAGAAGRPQ